MVMLTLKTSKLNIHSLTDFWTFGMISGSTLHVSKRNPTFKVFVSIIFLISSCSHTRELP